MARKEKEEKKRKEQNRSGQEWVHSWDSRGGSRMIKNNLGYMVGPCLKTIKSNEKHQLNKHKSKTKQSDNSDNKII